MWPYNTFPKPAVGFVQIKHMTIHLPSKTSGLSLLKYQLLSTESFSVYNIHTSLAMFNHMKLPQQRGYTLNHHNTEGTDHDI